ncbi:MAG: Gfo/Idh/MocA family oxidoreductase [Planctomycetes bacterium]|nr:Gfo/Idh/MocA family oxidoreductase [Planctomycetota bacterium]
MSPKNQHPNTRDTRRDFLKKSATAAAGFTVLPAYLVTGTRTEDGRLPPSKRINLAAIGVGGRASRVVPELCTGGKAEPVAFCDVDFAAARVEDNLKRFPGVRQFKDFRVMLEEMGKDVDAVCVATPDHTHFPATVLAMSMGKHVYVEKPLTHSYREADLLMRAERKFGVVTQMGNQGHTSGAAVQFRQLVERGVVRGITRVEAWKDANMFFMDAEKRFSEDPKEEPIPATLDWDLWCGPAERKPFSSKYHPFDWRAFWPYGNGMLGDWGAHIIDFVHDFLQLGQPTKIVPLRIDDPNEVLFPLSTHLAMSFPSRGEHPALELIWRDGADCRPQIPEQFHDEQPDGSLKAPDLGGAGTVLYRADGKLAITRGSHSGRSSVIPKARTEEYAEALQVTNPSLGHAASFTAACMGEGETLSPFRIGGELTKTLMLGIICQRLKEGLEFDRETERFVGNRQANALLDGPPPRRGWEEFYTMV